MGKKKLVNRVLAGLSTVMFLVALGMVFFYAPRETTMGEVQRIFYFHVATAWVGFFGFFVTFLGGIGYLATNDRRWDILALSSAKRVSPPFTASPPSSPCHSRGLPSAGGAPSIPRSSPAKAWHSPPR
jgi:ABC-type transport system involved in cytochrome c biogenesis permease subunit